MRDRRPADAVPPGRCGTGGGPPGDPPPPLPQRCIGTPPPGCPAFAQPLSPERQVPASMAFVTDSNRLQTPWQPPPTACFWGRL